MLDLSFSAERSGLGAAGTAAVTPPELSHPANGNPSATSATARRVSLIQRMRLFPAVASEKTVSIVSRISASTA
ncbi:MAG: hypothetical protein WAL67_01020 [Candidatus Cybelea sp.]